MKYKYVFLLGRPACGKSAVYRELERRILSSGQALTCERVDDFPTVRTRFRGDDALQKKGRERLYSTRTEDGVYQPKEGVFDDILREVSADVLRIDEPEHVIFLEFARPSYVEALQNFDKSILDRCIAIYIEASFETCWARNVARYEATVAEGQMGIFAKGSDDHFLPRETMESIYLHDDRDAFVQHMGERNIPVAVINNEAQGEEHLNQQVEELFETLF
jgi:hypothetical protein